MAYAYMECLGEGIIFGVMIWRYLESGVDAACRFRSCPGIDALLFPWLLGRGTFFPACRGVNGSSMFKQKVTRSLVYGTMLLVHAVHAFRQVGR